MPHTAERNASDRALTHWQKRFLKALETTTLRADTLLSDGYKITPSDRFGAYIVQTPERKYKGEEYRKLYEVDLANWTCDCEMFQFSMSHGANTCKHIDGVHKIVTRAVELVGGLIPAAVLPPRPKGAPRPSDPPYRAAERAEAQPLERTPSGVIPRPGYPIGQPCVRPPKPAYGSLARPLPPRGTPEYAQQCRNDFD